MNNNHGRRRTRRVRQQRKQQKTQIGRILLTVGLMALIAVVSIGGTIAWLTADTTPVTNTFTASDINIELKESENLDLQMVPGATITKDPKVTVKANSENLWLFVEIQESKIDGTDVAEFDDYLTYAIADGWKALRTYEVADNYYVYYRKVAQKTDEDQTYDVLENNQVQVKTDVTKTMMEAIKGNNVAKQPTITFKAYAVQSDNLPAVEGGEIAEANAAWELR